ncbi:uncharacterized protein LOC112503058 [Cynara cardunculus var. scolymus]|uniref:uncharacterized protein LOC112503058 n=1 Tax=Cynara cardunculus var. scolymus TaxID=59895 RepID=UPI000D62509E|nr:uncharacterized protein LOC112503058 [Cynara cardunculus var. scolymus]
MAVVLRYVDARGIVKERIFGIVHVTGTSSSILKSVIDTLFAEHGLSLKQVRGQGYDRASNMRVVVAVANKHDGVENFFNMLEMVINVVNASCKRKDMLRQFYKDRVQEAIGKCEIKTGTGRYQECSSMLKRTGIMVLVAHKQLRSQTCCHGLFKKKDQDILETVSLIRGTKQLLQQFRETGFDPLLKKMYSFSEANGIKALDMEDRYSKNGIQKTNITNRHYYKFDIFNTVVDMQIQEFGDRFSELSIELLKNIAALSPCDSFSQFNVSDLLKLSKLYSQDFSHMERIVLEKQLNMNYLIVRQDERFTDLSGIVELARLLVETKKHKTYPLVYRLLKLALVLPVATATVKRCFFAMKIVKSDLRNKIEMSAKNVNFSIDDVSFKPNNHMALLDIPANKSYYEEAATFLKNSPISFAISHEPVMVKEVLQQFWLTVEVVQ